jgi:hypothetical protein
MCKIYDWIAYYARPWEWPVDCPEFRSENPKAVVESYPTQDEPEEEVGFQYKMSLERVAC